MNFVRFIENRYQELTLETQIKDVYQPAKEAEIKALHQILSIYRTVLKYLLIPKCFYDYILVNLGLKKEPIPALMNKMKEEKKLKAVSNKMLEDQKNVEKNNPAQVT